MKVFTVEVQRTSYITLEIEAENKDEARDAAMREVEKRSDSAYADWNVTLCEEKTP